MRHAHIYIGLSDKEALWLGNRHNATGCYRHSPSFQDEVYMVITDFFSQHKLVNSFSYNTVQHFLPMLYLKSSNASHWNFEIKLAWSGVRVEGEYFNCCSPAVNIPTMCFNFV